MKKKVNGRVVQLREERSLLSRFLITLRKRLELDLEHCLGNFELTVYALIPPHIRWRSPCLYRWMEDASQHWEVMW